MAGRLRRAGAQGAVLALVLAAAVPLLQAPVASSLACAPARVEGLGDACLRPDGLWEVLDESGRSLGTTHGPDPVPDPGASGSADAARPVACVNEPDPQVDYYGHVLYARAHDDEDRFDEVAPQLRALWEQANGLVFASAALAGRAADLRMRCDAGTLTITPAELPTDRADADFASIVADVRALGFNNPKLKYWVWYDDTAACDCGGSAHILNDPTLRVTNPMNGNLNDAMFGVVFGYFSPRLLLHEAAHTLGAVQLNAPHNSGAFHCNDGLDVMCYADGGPRSNYNPGVCAVEVFDCKNDDYFHANPTAGSYLAIRWNLAHPFDRYVRGCMELRGVLPFGLGYPATSVPVEFVSQATVDVPAACQGSLFFLTGSGLTAPDMDICWLAGDAAAGCVATHENDGNEAGRVPATATKARVIFARGVDVTWTLKAT